MQSPDLSVIIPTYNRLPLLKEALASFVGLLDCSYEVIIVDDGSTDGTPEYLCTLGEPHRVFFQEHKGGNAARNYGLREARGRYVKFLDDDDWLLASIVGQQIRYLDIHNEIGVCYSDYGLVDDSGHVEIVSTTLDTTLENVLSGQRHYKVGYPNFAYTLRRSIARRVEWDEALAAAQDTDYFLCITLLGTTYGYLPGCVGWARHDQSYDRISSRSLSKRKTMQESLLYVLQKAERHLQERGRLTDSLRAILAQRYFDIAETIYSIDRDMAAFRSMIRTIHELYPQFEPAKPRYRLLKRVFGYEVATLLSDARRRLWARR